MRVSGAGSPPMTPPTPPTPPTTTTLGLECFSFFFWLFCLPPPRLFHPSPPPPSPSPLILPPLGSFILLLYFSVPLLLLLLFSPFSYSLFYFLMGHRGAAAKVSAWVFPWPPSYRVLPDPSGAFRNLPEPSGAFQSLPQPSGAFRTLPNSSGSAARHRGDRSADRRQQPYGSSDPVLPPLHPPLPPLPPSLFPFLWLKINKQHQANNNYLLILSYLFLAGDSVAILSPFRSTFSSIPIDFQERKKQNNSKQVINQITDIHTHTHIQHHQESLATLSDYYWFQAQT